MRGLLSDLPLLGVLELVHSTRQTGVLEVQAAVPYSVAFLEGEVVSGGILDWLGLEALYASPLFPESGSFAFGLRAVTGTPLGDFRHLVTDWARACDEWEQICAAIGSPSRHFQGSLPLFEEGGRSVRSAAREAEVPVWDVAQMVAQGVREGRLTPLDRYEWFRLRLNPPAKQTSDAPIGRALDGQKSLGDLVARGASIGEAREYLLSQLWAGLRFPGSGWVLRDLVWELKHA